MEANTVNNANKYDYMQEKLAKAVAFLKENDLTTYPVGKVVIEEGEIIADFQSYTTAPAEDIPLETHDVFFDVQYLIAGKEIFGFAPREGLTVATPYNETNDITFYEPSENRGYMVLNPGDFVIVSPDEAHQPRCAVEAPMDVKKIVIKVRA